MRVIALTKVWYSGKEWQMGEEFEYDDGADLRAAIAVGKVKPADAAGTPKEESAE
jgi:hypothetical protein